VCGYFLGNFGEKLGNFLFHRLVTLVRAKFIQFLITGGNRSVVQSAEMEKGEGKKVGEQNKKW